MPQVIGRVDLGEVLEADVTVEKRRIVLYLSPAEKGYDHSQTYLAMDEDRWTDRHTYSQGLAKGRPRLHIYL